MLVSAETDVLTTLHFIVRRKMQLYKSDDSVRANNFGGNESNFDEAYAPYNSDSGLNLIKKGKIFFIGSCIIFSKAVT